MAINRNLLIIYLVFQGYGCSSVPSNEEKQNLDIQINGKEAKNTKVNTNKSKKEINWKQFFKPPPNPIQFANLKNKLKSWPEQGQPNNLIRKARAQNLVGQVKAAEASYRQLLRNEPDHIQGHIELAQLYLKVNQLERCFSYLSRVKEIFGALEFTDRNMRFQYRYTLALAYIQQGNRKKGHEILSELIYMDKAFTPAYAAMASSYLKQGKIKTAQFVAKRGIDRGQEDPRLLNLLGVIAFKRSRYVEAKRWYNRALDKTSDFVPALVNRANLSIFQGEYEAAKMDLEHALGLNPIHTEAYIIQGILLKKSGQYRQSELAFQKAIDLDPENGYARYNLGVLKAESLSDHGEALRLFNEVLQVERAEESLKDLARLNIESLQQNRLEFTK